jgi:hypothetical protein
MRVGRRRGPPEPDQLHDAIAHYTLPPLITGWLAAVFAAVILLLDLGHTLDWWDHALLAVVVLAPLAGVLRAAHHAFAEFHRQTLPARHELHRGPR